MKAIMAGDILPAVQAIEAIDITNLSPPIEVPPIPAEAHPEYISREEHEFLFSEIARLKKERGAVVLAHNYMPEDIQEVADIVGDSLLLAKYGAASDAAILCEASVRFMQEILVVMKKPHQRVLAPDLGALCSLAAHADLGKIRAWKKEYPDGIIVSYVNTYLSVKAESDYCCASANSPQVISYVFERYSGPVLFLPDIYLGFYAARMLQKKGYSLDRLFLMMGACHVHDRIRTSHIEAARQRHPDAAVVAHIECGCQTGCTRLLDRGIIPEEMMQFRSTEGMVKFVKDMPQKEIIFATEIGMLHRMSKEAPDKVLIPASREAVCAYMKQNTLRKVYISLKDLIHEITVDSELAKRARIPIEKMLAIT